MKKSCTLLLLAVLAATPALAMEMTPFQIGFWGANAQLFPAETKVMGLRLNLAMSDNQDVMGFDVGLVSRAGRMDAFQLNLMNRVQAEFNGISAGLFNQTGSMSGVQMGLFNQVMHDVNGFQLGLFNMADDVTGFQLGLINRTVSLRGIQLGLINLVEQGPLTFFPLVNAAF
jgi:hypothetical protein